MKDDKNVREPIAKIEDSKLWRAVSKIARHAYNVYGLLSDDNWTLRSKFESCAFEVTNDVAEACGSLDPRDVKYSLSHARKDLFALKNAYSLAFHTGTIDINPEIMVAIDSAVEFIDDEVKALDLDFKQWHDDTADWEVKTV